MQMKNNNITPSDYHQSRIHKNLRKLQFFPAAVTPLKVKDYFYAFNQHIKKKGLQDFERAICSFVGIRNAYTFTSFMRAIYACLIFLKKRDDRFEIIIPRYSCPSFSHGILAAGLKIKYCDIDPYTLNLDLRNLKTEDLKNVLAVICVNYFGLSNPMDELSRFCKKNGIYLIEDLGYSLGTEYDNRKLGTFGDLSIYNFQEGKSIPIGGGMVTTNLDNFENIFLNKRDMAPPNFFQMVAYKTFSNPYGYKFFMDISKYLGENARKRFSMEDTIRRTKNEFDFTFNSSNPLFSISNFQGALGCSILSNITEMIKIREKNARLYDKNLSNQENLVLIQKLNRVNKVHYIRYPVLINENLREGILLELLKNGIEASAMYSDHGIQTVNSGYSGAEKVSKEILTIPCHPFMSDQDVEFVCEIINTVLDKP